MIRKHLISMSNNIRVYTHNFREKNQSQKRMKTLKNNCYQNISHTCKLILWALLHKYVYMHTLYKKYGLYPTRVADAEQTVLALHKNNTQPTWEK